VNATRDRIPLPGVSFAALLLLGLLSAPGCSPPDREAELRNTIGEMARAAEDHRPAPILERIADDFSGNRGAMDAAAAKRYVLGQTMSRDRLSVSLGSIDVTLHGDRATATVEASFAGSAAWLPGRGTQYSFETGWRLDDGQWRLIRADWKRQR